jgi:hypothetical protein
MNGIGDGGGSSSSPIFIVMKQWLRRLGYLIIVIIWLLVMAFPIFAFTLAGRGELTFGDTTGSHVRLFLLREPDAEGVGVEWTRPYRPQPTCTRTSITYIMWEGRSENTSYCQCFNEKSGAALPAACSLP